MILQQVHNCYTISLLHNNGSQTHTLYLNAEHEKCFRYEKFYAP